MDSMEKELHDLAASFELFKQTEFLVGIILLLTIVITVILLRKVEKFLVGKLNLVITKEQKIEKAKEMGQYVKGTIEGNQRKRDTKDNGYVTAAYIYSLDGVHQKRKVVGTHTGTRTHRFPEKINIYYWGNKVYTEYDKPSILPNLIYILVPIAVASLVLILFFPELIQ